MTKKFHCIVCDKGFLGGFASNGKGIYWHGDCEKEAQAVLEKMAVGLK